MKIIDLVKSQNAIDKLFAYGYLPARQVFSLSLVLPKVIECLDAYNIARNHLLTKYGTSADGENFTVDGEKNIAAYRAELQELEEQEADVTFPEDKVNLCVETIETMDKDLPPDKRLGFNAMDWAAIGKIVKVTETEG